jgi:hypothetical protein
MLKRFPPFTILEVCFIGYLVGFIVQNLVALDAIIFAQLIALVFWSWIVVRVLRKPKP